MYRFVPRNQYNFAIRRIKLLRIRLIENSKLSSNKYDDNDDLKECSRDFKLQSTVVSSDRFNNSVNKTTALSRILNEHDYRYSIDETFFKKEAQKASPNRQNKMFPNIPSSFNFHRNNESDSSLKRRKKASTSSNINNESDMTNSDTYEPTLKTMRIPISNEYDTYMLPNSFCVKNYKAFVYEYLEADGNESLKKKPF